MSMAVLGFDFFGRLSVCCLGMIMDIFFMFWDFLDASMGYRYKIPNM